MIAILENHPDTTLVKKRKEWKILNKSPKN